MPAITGSGYLAQMKRITCLFILGISGSGVLSQPTNMTAYKDPEVTQFFQRSAGWVSGDGAFSVPLVDGKVLWLFGDSHLDDLDPATDTMACLFQARNAALLQSVKSFKNATTLAGPDPGFRSWLKISNDGAKEWFWPMGGFQKDNALWIYLSALRKTTAAGPWAFENIGHDYWAKISLPKFEPEKYLALPSFNGISFANGLVPENEFVYAFGGKQRGIASDIYLARFKAATPASNWEFWDGRQWNRQVTNARVIAAGASSSVHVCKIREKFLLTTSQFSVACDQGKDIFMATSSKAEGPFKPLKKIFTIDDVFEGHLPFFYLPVAHPEFINSKGELLVTYSINNYEPCVSACINGRSIPDHYRPKAIRVPLALIDPDWK